MANPFVATSVTSYNSNPPADDGSQVAANLVAWNTIKTKLPDPIKTAFDTSETATNNAFAKIIGGGGFTTTGVSYAVLAADQGKFVKATASGIVITTPDATIVGSPFVFLVVNESTSDITLTGNNPGVQQTIDGTTSVTIPGGAGALVNTDGTNWFTGGQNFNLTQIVPQGRLTLVSGTPVMTSDQTAKTAVFYTPAKGNLCPIPNGSKYIVKSFAELTLTINGTNYLANNIHDVFIALDPADGATVIIGSGPAWTTATAGSGARGTGAGTTELVQLKGLYTNNNAITLRNNATTYSVALKSATYVGTIFIDGTNGQVSCYVSYGQSRKWGIWNAFNREEIVLLMGDGTGSWAYNTNTVRQSNGAAGNTITTLCGLAEESVDVHFDQNVNTATNVGTTALIGVGVNSTTTFSGFVPTARCIIGTTTNDAALHAHHVLVPAIGITNLNALENDSAGTTTANFTGGVANMLFTAKYLA